MHCRINANCYSALTGHNTSVLDSNCSLVGPTDQDFRRVRTIETPFSDQAYDDAVHAVYPFLSVWFTVANDERTECCQPAKSSLTCLRAGSVADGSRVPSALPPGKPYSYGPSISKGAIAGIVVGVVVGLAIAAGVAWWFLRKRKQPKSQHFAKVDSHDAHQVPQVDGVPIHELKSQTRTAELGGQSATEMPSHDKAYEMPSQGKTMELPSHEKPSELP